MQLLNQQILDQGLWKGSCLHSESTLHQISPYVGKMKSSMASALIERFTQPGDIVCDPFVGSGTIAVESLIHGRNAVCMDNNPYAVVLTLGKLNAPKSLDEALERATHYLNLCKTHSGRISIREIPQWVRNFFHPRTLREILALTGMLRSCKEHFLLSCMLGILHHQRPGFLSYPASHLIPYLRTRKYPRETFPELYTYRAVGPRLIAKIKRVYRRFPAINPVLTRKCYQGDIVFTSFPKNRFDAIITSPPYMNALDYGRDNRLRLFFLGVQQYSDCGPDINSEERFTKLMRQVLNRIHCSVKVNANCIFVLGDINRSRKAIRTVDLILRIVSENNRFKLIDVIEDDVPDIRRSRRYCECTKREWVVVLKTV